MLCASLGGGFAMRILLGILATSNVGQASPVYVHLGIIVSFNVEGFDLREKKKLAKSTVVGRIECHQA